MGGTRREKRREEKECGGREACAAKRLLEEGGRALKSRGGAGRAKNFRGKKWVKL